MTDTNLSARFAAQRLAFAPLMFQACRVLRDVGLLERAALRRDAGLTATEGVEETKVSRYAAELLLEAGLGAGLLTMEDSAPEPRFFITAMGIYWLRDPLTRVNAEFNHHVCYGAAFSLRDSLLEGRPAGLPAIDQTGAKTVYEALRSLPQEVKTAWFDFDHHYSDGVFELCLPQVLSKPGLTVVDIGANTGKFSRLCLERGAANVTLVDLPGQLAVAKEFLKDHEGRFTLAPKNLLDEASTIPAGAEVYWLSQFLDCFSEAEIRSILTRVRKALKPGARVFILETYWDQQQHEAARFCVIGTSLYFACVANGNSRMYHSRVMKRLLGEAGLKVTTETLNVGLSHTLLECGAA
jgi:ubiquinone/menaquinone biosynthesis C-methylase UbiE